MNTLQVSPHHFAAKLLAFMVAVAFVCQTMQPARAQSLAPEPRREQLLNGLHLLFVQRPGDAKVWMKLRVHSGAAFDLANKEGTMTLLSDALFPDPTTAQFVADELGGRLDVTTSYDSIEITLSGNASEFTRLAEILRNAVMQMRLAPEDIQRARDMRLKLARDARQDPALLADSYLRARLYGAFPYGRAMSGTPESLARVERGDLLLARDRFLSPNNATLVVVGGVDAARLMRTFRQFLGSWRKSDAISPATFRQPAVPDARTLIVPASGSTGAVVRLAARGVARSDRDRAAATVLALIALQRLQQATMEIKPTGLFVLHDAHALAGTFRMGATVPASMSASVLASARAVLRSLVTTAPSANELENAQREALNSDQRANQFPYADAWLDSITYNYDATADVRALSNVTPADVQRVAARLFGDERFATVVVGDVSELRATLTNVQGGVEVAGAQASAPSLIQPTPQPSPRRP